MVDKIAKVLDQVDVTGSGGGYTVHISPGLVLFLLLAALALGAWNSYELRSIRINLDHVVVQQNAIFEQQANIARATDAPVVKPLTEGR